MRILIKRATIKFLCVVFISHFLAFESFAQPADALAPPTSFQKNSSFMIEVFLNDLARFIGALLIRGDDLKDGLTPKLVEKEILIHTNPLAADLLRSDNRHRIAANETKYISSERSVLVPVDFFDEHSMVQKRFYCSFSLTPFIGIPEGSVSQINIGSGKIVYMYVSSGESKDLLHDDRRNKSKEKDSLGFSPPAWSRGLRMYFARVVPGKTLFTDLQQQALSAKEHGFNSFNMGFISDTSFYDKARYRSILSAYALDPGLIDWRLTDIRGKTMREKLESFMSMEHSAFEEFSRDPEIRAYAHVKAVDVLSGPDNTRYGVFETGYLETEDEASMILMEEYRLIYDIVMMEQYIAREQFLDVSRNIHGMGLKLGIRHPFFRAINGTDSLRSPGLFAKDKDYILPAGRNIGKLGEELWGNKKEQRGLGMYNWDQVTEEGFSVFLGPLDFYARKLGVDIVVQEAFEHSYAHREKFYPLLSKLCDDLDMLFVPDVSESLDPKLVGDYCIELGMTPLHSLDTASWLFGKDVSERWKLFVDSLYAKRSNRYIWMDTSDYVSDLDSKYSTLFEEPVDSVRIREVLFLIYGFLAPSYALTDVQDLDSAGLTVKNINHIREKYLPMFEDDKIRIVDVTGDGIVFIRFSDDMKKALLGIINVSGKTTKIRTNNLQLNHLGVDITEPFILKDIFNGRNIEFSHEKNNVFEDGNILHEMDHSGCSLFEIDLDMNAAILERLSFSMNSLIKHDQSGGHFIRTGTDGYEFESSRYTSISIPALTIMGEKDKAREIIIRMARKFDLKREDGMIMFNMNWLGSENYNTSDAPLWFINAVADYIERTGERDILDEYVGDHCSLGQLINDVVSRYMYGKERLAGSGINTGGIHRDEKTGFIWVPEQSTAMDTKHTPRQGYPCEIQGLWYKVLIGMKDVIDPEHKDFYGKESAKLKHNFNKYFWNEDEGFVYDALLTLGQEETEISNAIRDPAVRSNGVIALYSGIINEMHVGTVIKTVRSRLYLPGAIKSLAEPVTNYVEGATDPSWPHDEYYGYYDSSLPFHERDRVCHNGCGQPWIYPFFILSEVFYGHIPREYAVRSLVGNISNFLNDPSTGGDLMFKGSVPLITQPAFAHLYERQEGFIYFCSEPAHCYQSAAGVATSLMVLEKLLGEEYASHYVETRIDHDKVRPGTHIKDTSPGEKSVFFEKDTYGRSKIRIYLDQDPVNELSYKIKEGFVVSDKGHFPTSIEDYFPYIEYVVRNKKGFLERSLEKTNRGFSLSSRSQIEYIDLIAVGEGGLKVAFLAVARMVDNRDMYFSVRATKPTITDEDQNSVICSKYAWARHSEGGANYLTHFGADDTLYIGDFKNRTLIFSQEYVFGITLADILKDPHYSLKEKKRAVDSAVQFCLDIWDKHRFAIFDPKAENIIAVSGRIDRWKYIDMDKIFSGPEVQPIQITSKAEYLKILNSYYSDFLGEGIIEDVKPSQADRPDPEFFAREQKHALNLIKTVESISSSGSGPNFAIIFDSSWIKGYRDSRGRILDMPLYHLMLSLRRFCERNNIIFLENNGLEGLYSDFSSLSREHENMDILVMGEKGVLGDPRFRGRERTFIAGVDNSHITERSYKRIIQMLNLLMQLSKLDLFENDDIIMRLYPRLGFHRINETMFFFMPTLPEEYDDLKKIYSLLTFA